MVAENKVSRTHHLKKLRFYGNEFVFNTVSGMCYRISTTAAFVLRAIIDGADNEQLVDLIQSNYDVDRAAAMRDVELLLNDLTELGVLD